MHRGHIRELHRVAVLVGDDGVGVTLRSEQLIVGADGVGLTLPSQLPLAWSTLTWPITVRNCSRLMP